MKLFRFLSLFSAVLLIACEPDPIVVDPVDNPPTSPFSSVEEVLESLEPPVESFVIDASSGGSFTTSRGSKVTIPANALITPSGQTVSGNVDFTMQEIFTPADMITTGAFTESNGVVLTSGGAYFLGAEQNGQQLSISNSSSVNVEIPEQATDPNMQLFFGGSSMASPPAWQVVNDSTRLWNLLRQAGVYQVTQSLFGWVNCDAFSSSSFDEPVHFDLNGISGLNQSNTVLFVVEPSTNSAYGLRSGTNYTFTNSQVRGASVRTGIQQYVIAIGFINNQVVYGSTLITPAVGNTYPVQMAAVTQADLMNYLANL